MPKNPDSTPIRPLTGEFSAMFKEYGRDVLAINAGRVALGDLYRQIQAIQDEIEPHLNRFNRTDQPRHDRSEVAPDGQLFAVTIEDPSGVKLYKRQSRADDGFTPIFEEVDLTNLSKSDSPVVFAAHRLRHHSPNDGDMTVQDNPATYTFIDQAHDYRLVVPADSETGLPAGVDLGLIDKSDLDEVADSGRVTLLPNYTN